MSVLSPDNGEIVAILNSNLDNNFGDFYPENLLLIKFSENIIFGIYNCDIQNFRVGDKLKKNQIIGETRSCNNIIRPISIIYLELTGPSNNFYYGIFEVPSSSNPSLETDMYNLTEEELKSKILGCGDGPSSFNSECKNNVGCR